MLDQGKVLGDGTVDEIERDPRRCRRCIPAVSDPLLLEVAGLCAGYGRSQALFDLSLSIPATGAVAILGRNGAGKTTLLKTIARRDPADVGHASGSAGSE